MNTIFLLLIIFQLKHYICDYPLQNEYMLGKFKEKGWVLPLLSHALVHAKFTMIIVLLFNESFTKALGLGLLDLTLHFIMDRIKASPKLLGKYKSMTKEQYVGSLERVDKLKKQSEVIRTSDMTNMYIKALNEHKQLKKSNSMFWNSLGVDQMVHHLTHYILIYLIVGVL